MTRSIYSEIKGKRRGQPFEIDHRSGKKGLDGHVPATAPHRPVQAMLRFGLAMNAFDLPAVTSVKLSPD
jgi:hypothetical protein